MKKTGHKFRRHLQHGQALTEYALILVMVAVLFGVTLAATGPAIGNVFSNVVYNIIGGKPEDVEDLAAGRGNADAFWATVEWLATNPPEERAFAQNTPLPPPASPTEGPSPTPTPITPSPEPSDTPTRTPSPTPLDEGHSAPWQDTIDHPKWWRVNSNTWLGSDQFFGQYFANATLSPDPAFELWHQELGVDDWGAIDFNWPSGSGPIESGFTDHDYSIRWTRQIGFGFKKTPSDTGETDPKQVRFSITTGGGQSGARVWLYEVDGTTPQTGCSSVTSGGSSSGDSVYGDGQSPSGSPTDCLVIDAWRDNAETVSVTRTIEAQKLYIVQVDFYKHDGDGIVKLGMDNVTVGNPDDVSLVSGSSPQCSWNQADTLRSNSSVFIWEQSPDLEFPANQTCYLELRGWVDFTLLSNPKLIFWDVWDMSSANTEVWVEVGEYMPNRADITWTQIPLRKGTTNYAWTRNIINLASYVSGYSQKRLALRFAMRDNNGGARRRWWLDDIEIRNFNTKTFTVCTGSKDACGSYWNMDDATYTLGAYKENIDPQFVTSGRWTLGTTNAQGKYSLGLTPPLRSNITDGGNRIHFVEFNGNIDVTGNVPDFDGDDGVAVLTFHQAFQVKKGTQLELQWTRDVADTEPDNWQTLETLVADPGSSGTISQPLEETTILLDGVPNWDSQPFRLRFAMIVKPDATESGGWWIDNVLIHRFDKPRYSDYPFTDTAQGGTDNWLTQGTWGITDQTNITPNLYAGTGRAFADSPSGNYVSGTNSSLILRHPIDLNFDTPENTDPTDDSNSQSAAASHPVLTFWHWRELKQNHEFDVEWSNDRGQSWKTIWRYVPSANSPVANGYIQRAWEFVTIDLSDIQANVATNAGDLYDDDIIIRFRLNASAGGTTDDGVYIDDIRVDNYSETSHKLWDPDEVSPTYGAGANRRYVDDFDSPVEYWDRWHLGGFSGIDEIQHSGLISLHDSPPKSNGSAVMTTKRTYNVAAMDKIIDLRALTSSDVPVLYFWTRYDIGDNDNIQAQIAPEDTSYSPTNGSGVQNASEYNYERVKGWGAWSTRWEQTEYSRVDTWYRAAIDLKPYVGKRIKLRFVYNALNGDTKRDGWFIDDVIFDYRVTAPVPLPFSDSAKSLGNWITEGSWGLAPDQWRGTGGGPADIGNDFWTGVYYDCERHRSGDRCYNATDFNNLLYTNYSSKIERDYDPDLDIQEFALEIDHDFGSSQRPIGGLLDPTWDDYYAGRWKRPITIQNPADVTFITASDDGVRLRYSGTGAPSNPYWNIIDDWGYHGRKIDISTITFAKGSYELTLEWFEGGGSAVIIMSAGVNNFSFGDSPKAGNGPSFPVVNSTPYGNSSLILRNPIDLTGTTLPVIEYYTRYKLGSTGTARFQISTNGGFDWITPTSATSGYGFNCPPSTDCYPTWNGTYWPDAAGDWRRKQHSLGAYKTTTNGGPVLNLRFNLVTGEYVDDGLYITDVQINP